MTYFIGISCRARGCCRTRTSRPKFCCLTGTEISEGTDFCRQNRFDPVYTWTFNSWHLGLAPFYPSYYKLKRIEHVSTGMYMLKRAYICWNRYKNVLKKLFSEPKLALCFNNWSGPPTDQSSQRWRWGRPRRSSSWDCGPRWGHFKRTGEHSLTLFIWKETFCNSKTH